MSWCGVGLRSDGSKRVDKGDTGRTWTGVGLSGSDLWRDVREPILWEGRRDVSGRSRWEVRVPVKDVDFRGEGESRPWSRGTEVL